MEKNFIKCRMFVLCMLRFYLEVKHAIVCIDFII